MTRASPGPALPGDCDRESGFVANARCDAPPSVFPQGVQNRKHKSTCGPKPACASVTLGFLPRDHFLLYVSAGLSFGLAMAFLSDSLIGMPTTLPRGGIGPVNHLA